MSLFEGFQLIKATFSSESKNSLGSSFSLPAYPKSGNVLVPLFNAKDIFSAENALLQKAQKGDEVWLSIYEIQNAMINGKDRTCKGTEGYEEQQALVPNLISAQARGAKVHVIVDVSNFDGKPSENIPLMKYLEEKGIDIRPYPIKYVKINHCKNLVLIHHNTSKKVEYWGIGAGGMNMGNHSAANHDTMILMAGTSAYNMLVHVIRPQWQVSGGDVSSLPSEEVEDPEVRWLNTAPPEENHGIPQSEIKSAYLMLFKKALELVQKGLKPHIRVCQFVVSNPAVAYGLRDAALAGADVEVLLDPNVYADQAKQNWQSETWSRKVLESGGVKVRFFNADVKSKQKLHDKWISLSYVRADGNEVPVELISGSANASKAGLEPAGPGTKREQHAPSRFTLSDESLDVPMEGSPKPQFAFAKWISEIGKRIPKVIFRQTNSDLGKKQFFTRTNREADALIFNSSVVKAYNAEFDRLMTTQSVGEPLVGSGFSTVF
jgi:hypothetical protein